MRAPSDPAPGEAIPVVAAVIRRGGRLLVGRRPDHKRHGGLWEFPGGKLESGESWTQGIARELDEELGLRLLRAGDVVFEAHDPASPYRIVFVEAEVTGLVDAREHSEVGWFTPRQLRDMPLAPTDAAFITRLLKG